MQQGARPLCLQMKDRRLNAGEILSLSTFPQWQQYALLILIDFALDRSGALEPSIEFNPANAKIAREMIVTPELLSVLPSFEGSIGDGGKTLSVLRDRRSFNTGQRYDPSTIQYSSISAVKNFFSRTPNAQKKFQL
jgi:hypothetical protein